MISCGEASGDLYAGALTAALRRSHPDVEVFGFGGPRLRDAGATLVGDYHGVSVTGITEVVSVLARARAMLRSLGDAARERKPKVFVAIDFPDFNFRLLPVLKALGVPIVYYVSPQIWAWREHRLKRLREFVDRMLVIFPFEVEYYEKAGIPVEFVGHPLVDLAVASQPRETFLASLNVRADRPLLACLPGSRSNEVRALLPALVEAATIVASTVHGVQLIVARAPGLPDDLFAPLDRARQSGMPVALVEHATDDVLAAADVVMTASGTATVQAALHGKPMVVVYRLSGVTYAMARSFVRLRTYGMVNLVAGRKIVPEVIQGDFSASNVAREVLPLFTDAARVERMRADIAEVRAKFGAPGASQRAAQAVATYLT